MAKKQSKRKEPPTMAATTATVTPAPPQKRSKTIMNSERVRQHIDDKRKDKFSTGENSPNPLTGDLHHAHTTLSSDLYTKTHHFLMEIIQIAEDNEYLAGVEPTLEFLLTSDDVTGYGTPATLLVFNNEVGFSSQDIISVCSIGLRSTKKGPRNKGFTAKTGTGFKCLFLVSASPHIFSHGYQIRFNEMPNKDSGIAYVVPQWVEDKPTISDTQGCYTTRKTLPTTVILPLKPEKVTAVRNQLSELDPEALLFLSKIKRISIGKISGESLGVDSVSSIETELTCSRNQGTHLSTVHLSIKRKNLNTESSTNSYYIWRQTFPVNPKSKVAERKEMKEWVC